MKLKYIQLVNKGSEWKTLISVSPKQLEKYVLDGYQAFGFDLENEVPINPIVNGDSVREMTIQELTEKRNNIAIDNALSKHVFTRLQIREAFKSLSINDKLDTLLLNNEFKTYWLEADFIDLDHYITKLAMADFTEEEIQNLKLKIAGIA